jgi:hypothetical protein
LLATIFSYGCNRYAMLIFFIQCSTPKVLDEVNPQNVSAEQAVSMLVLLQIEIALLPEDNIFIQ